MTGILIRALITGAGIWLATVVVPGVGYDTWGALAWSAIALGLINAVLRPLVVVLTFPLTVLTFGLFLVVVNAAMLNLAGWLVDGFEIEGFWSSVFGGIVISLFSGLCSNFIGEHGRYEVLIVRRERR